jgi:hypothetical protein
MGNRQNRQNVVSIGKPHPPTIIEESNLPIKSQPCIRFDISDKSQHPQILSHLEHHGFVVIAAVADAAQVVRFLFTFNDDIGSCFSSVR